MGPLAGGVGSHPRGAPVEDSRGASFTCLSASGAWPPSPTAQLRCGRRVRSSHPEHEPGSRSGSGRGDPGPVANPTQPTQTKYDSDSECEPESLASGPPLL